MLGVFAATVVAGAAYAVLLGPGCTLTSNDAPPDASTIDAPFRHPTVCAACSIQQCTGQLAVCLQSADCTSILTCANGGGGAQGCFCGADGGARGQNAFRALAACDEVSACGGCAAQCKDTIDAAVCASPGAPLSADRCAALDASADASDDVAQLPDAGDDGAVDAGDDGAALADAAVAEAGASDAGVDAPSLAACSPCVETSCADPKRACGVGSECDLFLQCAAACAGAGCVDVCGSVHGSGKTAAAALASCALSNCSTACGL